MWRFELFIVSIIIMECSNVNENFRIIWWNEKYIYIYIDSESRKSVNDCILGKFTEIEGRVMPLRLEVTVYYQFVHKTVTCNV